MKIQNLIYHLLYSEAIIDKKLNNLKAEVEKLNLHNTNLQVTSLIFNNKTERLKYKLRLKNHYNDLINEYYEINIW